jgi:hypothetical protein
MSPTPSHNSQKQKKAILFLIIASLAIGVAGAAHASFLPGATLDPGCGPLDPGCIVVLPSVSTSTVSTTTINGTQGPVFTFTTSTAIGTWTMSTSTGQITITLPSNVSFFVNDASYVTSSITSVNGIASSSITLIPGSNITISTSTNGITINAASSSPATMSTLGIIRLSGDIGGNASSVLVTGLQGYPVASTTPTSSQVLAWNGSKWAPSNASSTLPSGITSDGSNGLNVSGNVAVGTAVLTNAEYNNGTCTTSKAISAANGNRQKITLTNAQTCMLSFTQPSSGTISITLKVIQSSAGSFNGLISTTSTCKWPGGTVPTITATAGAIDFVSFYLDGSGCFGSASQNFQ